MCSDYSTNDSDCVALAENLHSTDRLPQDITVDLVEKQSYSAQPRVCKNDDHAPVYTFRICTMQKTFVLTLRSFKLNRFLLFYSFLWVKLLITLWICHIMANPA